MTRIFLETKRLILKPLALSDFDDLVALRQDPDVMRYIGHGTIQTKEQVSDFVNTALLYQKKHGIGFCSVFEKDSGEFVGQAGLFHITYDDTQPDIELAYRLHKKFWGKGYATELAKALIHWGFEQLPITKLIAVAHPLNYGSQQVLKKSGLDFRRTLTWYNGIDVFLYDIYKNDAIELVEYDPNWPQLAATEMKKLTECLPKKHIIDIQHVGSTAIPGMLAKPIIDIQIAVDSLDTIKGTAISLLKKCGYEFWYDNPDTTRLFFVKGMPPFGTGRSHHVHIVEHNSKQWLEKILFRDYLIAHPACAEQYRQLKLTLAKQHTHDRERYTELKTQFIHGILCKTQNMS